MFGDLSGWIDMVFEGLSDSGARIRRIHEGSGNDYEFIPRLETNIILENPRRSCQKDM